MDGGKLHDKEFQNLNPSPGIVREIISGIKIQIECVAYIRKREM
jgi:hypothetical protein